MKIRFLVTISALGFSLCGCSRSTPEYATPKSLKREFVAQFNRIDFYTRNFTSLMHAVPFPPEGTDEIDRPLFQIPSILNVEILDESTHIAMHPEAWARDPLNRESFWFTPAESDSPKVKIGKGTTKSGKEIEIAVYEEVVVEAATGKKVRITFDFDLNELKKHAESGPRE